jgi:hypothetical protein
MCANAARYVLGYLLDSQRLEFLIQANPTNRLRSKKGTLMKPPLPAPKAMISNSTDPPNALSRWTKNQKQTARTTTEAQAVSM